MDQYKIVMDVVGEGAVRSATNALKTFGGVIAGIATLQFAQSVLTLADDMSDLADAAGLSMAAVTGFSLAVQQAGGTFEGAGKGITKFYKALEEAGGDQTSKAAETLRKVGITLDDIRTKSEGQLLVQALDELAKMDAGAARTAATLELFGKSMAGIDPGALMEILKSTDAEGFAEKLTKVKDANDKMSAAMFNFKAAAAGAMAPLLPLLNGIISVVGVFANQLDVLAVAMGAVFGAAMLANIGKITTAMRLFAASNPFTLIAMAVGTLVVVVGELIDTYGSFGNAMKAVGNMGINLINTLMNGFAGFSQFIAGVMTGVGNAILAGLNPFSDKSAMGELQVGFQKGVNAFKQQMASEGAIKFKFAVQPVVKKKGASALDALLADQGGLGASATGLTEQQAEARAKEALSAQQITAQMRLQNDEANKLRRLSLDLIGIDSDRANLIRSNAQAESDGAKQIADLEAKINQEKAKGATRNAAVIVELQKQIAITKNQTAAVMELNEEEFKRLEYQKGVTRALSNAQQKIVREGKQNIANKEEEINAQRVLGKMNSDQAALELQKETRRLQFQTEEKQLENQLFDIRRRSTQNNSEATRALEDKLTNLREEYKLNETILAQRLNGEAAIQDSIKAGVTDSLANMAKQFEPYIMAQNAVALGWKKVSDALDTFIETGKFSFKDFARSILLDLTKMIAQAMVFKYIFNPIMSSLGLPTASPKAMGGPVSANEPYMVGEKGPELFVPKNAGDIIPNNKLGSAAQATGTGMISAPVTNNYITNNINALDSRSVAQLFVENRKTLLGTVQMAQKEMPYRTI